MNASFICSFPSFSLNGSNFSLLLLLCNCDTKASLLLYWVTERRCCLKLRKKNTCKLLNRLFIIFLTSLSRLDTIRNQNNNSRELYFCLFFAENKRINLTMFISFKSYANWLCQNGKVGEKRECKCIIIEERTCITRLTALFIQAHSTTCEET